MTPQVKELMKLTKASLLETSSDRQYSWYMADFGLIREAIKTSLVGANTIAAVRYLFHEANDGYYEDQEELFKRHGVTSRQTEVLALILELAGEDPYEYQYS